MPEESEKKVSKFSAGLNIITRLDILWKKTHLYIENGKYMDWNTTLDIIWLELTRDLDSDEYEDSKEKDGKDVKGYKTQFDSFDKELIKELPFQDSNSGFKSPPKGAMEKRNNQYKILMEKQRFLARLENEIGKGTSWGEAEDDWD